MPIDVGKAGDTWLRYQYLRDNGHTDYVNKAKKCEDFFAGLQWDPSDLALLKAVRRPALTINKIISTIANVMGEQIYNRTDIAFRPRNEGATQAVADALTKVFMQISDNNQLEWTRSDVFADGIITSRGFYDARLRFTDSLFGEVQVSQLNPKNVLIDCDADEYDPDKWNDVLVTRWMSPDTIALLYSKDDAENLKASDHSFWPYNYDAVDRDRDRFGTQLAAPFGGSVHEMQHLMRFVRVVERQHKTLDVVEHFASVRLGDMRPVPSSWERDRIAAYLATNPELVVIKKRVPRIRWTVVADKYVLHDDWSPYKRFTVVPFFPFFRRGKTVGLVENLIGPQELLNKSSSQELHVINTTANSGWKLKAGSLTNMTTGELEARGAETGLVIELQDVKDAEKIQPNQIPTGLDRITFKAEEHIKTISGISDYRTGSAREDVSAKAIGKNQAAASANTAKVMDNLQRTDALLARHILDMVQEYYTEERVVNIVTDKLLNTTEQLTVNQVGPEGAIVNDLTLGEYVVVVTAQPERDTFEDTQFDHAIALRKEGVQLPDKYIIKSSKLRDKGEIVQAMEAAEQDPIAQEQKQLALEMQKGEVRKVHADASAKEADAAKKVAEAQKDAATDQNAEFVAKMQELQQEFELKKRELEFNMQLETMKAQQELEIERMKAETKLQIEREMAEQKKALVDAQVTATHAQAAATIKTADAKAEAMKAAPASAAASGSGSSADTGAKPKKGAK
jgi:hypothetical protein